MRIVSYNIRKAVGLDWRRDGERIVDVLDEIKADVVVLQEADRRIGTRAGVLPLDRIKDRLGLQLADVALRPGSHGWHGNAILFASHLGPAHARRIPLPTLEPRGAVALTLPRLGLEVIGAHLGLTPGMRRRQMLHLADHIAQASHPVVIGGDLNAIRIPDDAFGASARLASPGPSFHAARPAFGFDRFVVSGAVRLCSAHVHMSDLARRASDHLPVVADIAVPGHDP